MNKLKVVILGSSGQLGNSLILYLIKKKINCFSITHKTKKFLNSKYLYDHVCTKNNNFERIKKKIKKFNPTHMINCFSIEKDKMQNKKILNEVYISLTKKYIDFANKNKITFINIGTDIVFDGKKGLYKEADKPNPFTLYGKYKLKAEKKFKNILTLRMSIISFNPIKKNGFINWVISKKYRINGFRNYYFSGISSLEASRLIFKILLSRKKILGVFNLSGKRINKLELIKIICKIYRIKRKVVAYEEPKIDLSLIGDKLKNIYKFKINNIESQMIAIKNFYDK